MTFDGTGVPVWRIIDGSAGVVKLTPQQRIQRRTGEVMEMPVPQTHTYPIMRKCPQARGNPSRQTEWQYSVNQIHTRRQ